jgi:hypothetical protein
LLKEISSNHVKTLIAFFEKEKFSIPTEFSKEDVNLGASALFTDAFCLTYINHVSRTGLLAYGGFMR